MATEGSVNPDLVKERAGATFNVREMTNLWDGGAEKTKRRQEIERIVYTDPEFDGPDIQHLSREELYAESLRKHIHAWKVIKKHNLTEPTDLMYLLRLALNGRSGLTLHDGAFVPTLRMQASDEQLARWLPLIQSSQMLGCYAQTELGHGTFVRGLETTATYNSKTKEFVLSTPQITSTKWWVGGLGKSANYAVLLAQLYTKGHCHGLHPFLVRLRDENHNPLPGITVGDIGPKFGYNAVDNGFLRLDSVRIPRDNMLMRYSKVLEDGTYVKPENDRIVYSGMLGIRANLPLQVAALLAKGVAIAIRYSCVRRQSELTPGQREPQVLDFQTQQHKLLPLLATAYAYKFAGLAMLDLFLEIITEVKGGNYRRLIEAHALSSGLKAVTTTNASAGIETCRLACGGHGYLQVSRLPELYTYCVAMVTAEGEATILLLQTARYLLKNCMQVQRNKKVDDFVSYLNAAKGEPGAATAKFSGSFELDSLLSAFEFRALRLVTRAAERLQKLVVEEGVSQENAFNLSSIQLVKAATAHIDYVVLRLFVSRLRAIQCSAPVRAALTALCTLHAVHRILQNTGDYLLDDYMSRGDVAALTSRLYTLYGVVRKDAIALVDAFDMEQELEASALGRYDGRVYDNLLKSAAQSGLNKTQVHQSFHDYLKPLQESRRAKL